LPVRTPPTFGHGLLSKIASAFVIAAMAPVRPILGAKLPSSNHTLPSVRMNASFAVVLTVMGTALGFMAGGLIGGFSEITKFITFII
jgi:hypothetical protein